jgi:DNA-binding CsgD family transcriptional regulator
MIGPSAPDQSERLVQRTVDSAAYGVALAALRTGLLLAALAAATDWLFAMAGGHLTLATVGGGVLLTGLAIGALVRTDVAARVLRPAGRVTMLAAVFAVAGAVDFGLQSHYGEVASAIMFIAALVSSAPWVALSLAVSVFGYLGDLAIQGRSLHWMLVGSGQSAVGNQIVDLILNALAGLVLIALLRRFLTRVPATLQAARSDGVALTPRLANAVAGATVKQLPRADATAVIEPLTTAEREVLALLARGRAPKQAARDLSVAISTVRSHIAAAKRKTGARTLEQLVALFAEADLAR